MSTNPELASFINGTFRSVWALELLVFLKKHGDRAWPRSELVEALRASDAVISGSVDSLLAAGLIVLGEDGAARYGPANAALEGCAEATAALYAQRPDAVRRMIIQASSGGLAAFADAFRLRKDTDK